jgi:hypothetical protein
MGSEYEVLLKTVNSFGSFNNSGHYMNHPAQSQDSICSGRLQRSRIYKAQNSSSIDPGYNISTIILEKAKSYPVNQNRVSQMSNASNMMLSRESMHLTPQFQSPDV